MKVLVTGFFFMFYLSSVWSKTLPDGLQVLPPVDNDKQNQKEKVPAEQPQPMDYTRKVTDLIAFPNEKEFFISLNHTYSTSESVLEYASQEYASIKGKGAELTMQAAYGISNEWAAGISLGRSLGHVSETKNGPASTDNGESTEVGSSGDSDPALFAVYRAMDVSKDRYDVNLYINHSPKTENEVSGTESKDGNNAKGSRNTTLGVEWGRREGKTSWSMTVEYLNYGEANSEDAESKDVTVTDSFSVTTLAGKYQWTLSSTVKMDLMLAYIIGDDIDVTYEDGSSVKVENARAMGISGKANVRLYNETFLVLELASISTGDRDYVYSNGTILTEEDNIASNVSVGIKSQF